MALIVSSASWSRRRSSLHGPRRPGGSLLLSHRLGLARCGRMSRPTSTRCSSDMSPINRRSGRREPLDQRGRGDDLVAAGERQILVDVHDLEVVQALQMLLADATDILNRPHRLAGRARDIQPEQVFRLRAGARPRLPAAPALRSRPASHATAAWPQVESRRGRSPRWTGRR